MYVGRPPSRTFYGGDGTVGLVGEVPKNRGPRHLFIYQLILEFRRFEINSPSPKGKINLVEGVG